MRANKYLYLAGAIDVGSRFHNCVRESGKTFLVPVWTKEITVDHEGVETELNNLGTQ